MSKKFVDYGEYAINFLSVIGIAILGYLMYKFLIALLAYALSKNLVSFFVLVRGVFTVTTELQNPFSFSNLFSGAIMTPALQLATFYLIYRSIKIFMGIANKQFNSYIYKEKDVFYAGLMTILLFVFLEIISFSQDITIVSSIAHFTFLLASKISYVVFFLTIVHLHFLNIDEYKRNIHTYLQLTPNENKVLFSPWRLLLVTYAIGVILNLPFYFGIQFLSNNWLILVFFILACTLFYYVFRNYLSKGFNHLGVVLLAEIPVNIIPNIKVFDKNQERKIYISLAVIAALFLVLKFKLFYFSLFFIAMFLIIYALVFCFVYFLGLGISLFRSLIHKHQLPVIKLWIIQDYFKNIAFSTVNAASPLLIVMLMILITISFFPKKFVNKNENYVRSVLDLNGQVVFRETTDKNECIAIAYSEIPEFLMKCLMLSEDRDFMKQKKLFPAQFLKTSNWQGFSFASFYRFAKNGGGGSNINMQLMKNAALPSRFPQDIQKKFSELITSYQLSIRYSPEEIASFYLNRVSFCGGRGHSGIMAASLFTFGIPVSKLNNLEMLYLVSTLKHGTHFKTKNRLVRYEEACNYSKEIKSTLISLAESWYKQNLLTKKELQSLKRIELQFSNKRYKTNFTTTNLFLSSEMKKTECHGTTFVTSISKMNQQKMSKAINKFESRFKNVLKRNNYTLYSSALVISVKTGEILAHHGGRGVSDLTRFSDGNPIASLIKPFVLLELLEKGYKTSEINLFDGKIKGRMTPHNLNRKFTNQNVGINKIIKESLNAPLTNIDQLTNPIDLFRDMEKHFSKMNLSIDNSISLDNNKKRKEYEMNYPLGSRRMTVYELAQIYQTLFNDGKYIKLKAISSSYDPVMNRNSKIKSNEIGIYNPKSIKIIKVALSQPLQSGGTAHHIANLLPQYKRIYAKTGTSDSSIHGYTVLCDDNILIVSWTSYGKVVDKRLELNQTPPIPYNSGAKSAGELAATIYCEFKNSIKYDQETN